ncbi:peptidase M20 [Lysobacteraceae bacterium NML91-0213]|nr:peptidase M20 [Xanthomonadaceae bacterium NML91-0213]
MNHRLTLTLLAGACLALSACQRSPDTAAHPEVPKNETADQFVARVNDEYRALYPETTAAQWLSSTHISDDSQLLAAKASERWLTKLNGWIEQARRFEGQDMSPETARAIHLLKLKTAMPAPRDPEKLSELTRIATRMEGTYGAGTYCTGEGAQRSCRQLGELEDVLRDSRDYDRQLDAWQGWHGVARPMRQDYVRFVDLVNEGAREMGYADAGEMWRSGYDMSPVELSAETDRLWNQVKPLYEQLHCYARTRLQARYPGQGDVNGMLPAHLMGNMWQQDWSSLWDILAPYPNAGSLDVTATLERQYREGYDRRLAAMNTLPDPTGLAEEERAAQVAIATTMTRRAEDFYTSLGMPQLPDAFWQKSQLIKPRDRDVVCHASAWPMDLADDVRIKMCIKPNEEDFTTVYHELGHIYYYLAQKALPPLFQEGAHDGFHEAIGDTIVLAMTPSYLASIGLVDTPEQSQAALINSQMRMALSKVAFLPFGLMIDRWRWGVFDGSITPENYNSSWWELKARYQGVAPVSPRGEEFFDAGAKYHVPGNTPYTRYFLAHILQFQFYKALCGAAGHEGALYDCSFYGNAQAGEKFWTMLGRGASQPWQATLQEMTGSDRMDAGAVLEYFAPLQDWLKAQNEGQPCGWSAAAVPEAAAAP